MSVHAPEWGRGDKFKLEWSIITEKLQQGINGVEWLVLNWTPTENKMQSFEEWVESLQLYGFTDTEAVMASALLMDSDAFYAKYEFNWWMSVSYTLTYLVLLRQRHYNRYFDFIQKLQEEKTS